MYPPLYSKIIKSSCIVPPQNQWKIAYWILQSLCQFGTIYTPTTNPIYTLTHAELIIVITHTYKHIFSHIVQILQQVPPIRFSFIFSECRATHLLKLDYIFIALFHLIWWYETSRRSWFSIFRFGIEMP